MKVLYLKVYKIIFPIDSNINITLNRIGEGKDKAKINKIFKEVDLKIAEENNQYAPTIYRKGVIEVDKFNCDKLNK